jgi:hypothetical protein
MILIMTHWEVTLRSRCYNLCSRCQLLLVVRSTQYVLETIDFEAGCLLLFFQERVSTFATRSNDDYGLAGIGCSDQRECTVAGVDGYLVYTFVQTILRTVIYVHNQYRL